MMFWKKKNEQHSSRNTVAKQYKLLQRKLDCGLWNSLKDAEEKARAWANIEMVSCVADPPESEEKWFTNKRRESNWCLSETGLLLATRAAVIALIYKALFL